MKHAFEPVLNRACRTDWRGGFAAMIQNGNYRRGDRLPPIMEMARQFGVGHPTVREALKKLETVGVVEIRHGSGVYVSRSEEVLVLASPDFAGTVTKKLLLDLIQARMPIEMQSDADRVRNATPEQLLELKRMLASAGQNLDNDDVLNSINMAFHRQIALASGNTVSRSCSTCCRTSSPTSSD